MNSQSQRTITTTAVSTFPVTSIVTDTVTARWGGLVGNEGIQVTAVSEVPTMVRPLFQQPSPLRTFLYSQQTPVMSLLVFTMVLPVIPTVTITTSHLVTKAADVQSAS